MLAEVECHVAVASVVLGFRSKWMGKPATSRVKWPSGHLYLSTELNSKGQSVINQHTLCIYSEMVKARERLCLSEMTNTSDKRLPTTSKQSKQSSSDRRAFWQDKQYNIKHTTTKMSNGLQRNNFRKHKLNTLLFKKKKIFMLDPIQIIFWLRTLICTHCSSPWKQG